jgi:hypothetical protein
MPKTEEIEVKNVDEKQEFFQKAQDGFHFSLTFSSFCKTQK